MFGKKKDKTHTSSETLDSGSASLKTSAIHTMADDLAAAQNGRAPKQKADTARDSKPAASKKNASHPQEKGQVSSASDSPFLGGGGNAMRAEREPETPNRTKQQESKDAKSFEKPPVSPHSEKTSEPTSSGKHAYPDAPRHFRGGPSSSRSSRSSMPKPVFEKSEGSHGKRFPVHDGKRDALAPRKASAVPDGGAGGKKESAIHVDKIPPSLKNTLWGVGGLVLLAAVAVGGYYAWNRFGPMILAPIEPQENPIPLNPESAKSENIPEPPEDAFSYTKDSIHTVFVENEGIDNALSELRGELEDMPSGDVYAFSLKSPAGDAMVAGEMFPVLAETLGRYVEMSDWLLLASIEEYGVRFGAMVRVDDVSRARNNLRNGEQAGASIIAPLYPEGVADGNDPGFASSVYDATSIRYDNIDGQENFSMDYATSGEYVVLATSKEAMRGILDEVETFDLLLQDNQADSGNGERSL